MHSNYCKHNTNEHSVFYYKTFLFYNQAKYYNTMQVAIIMKQL